MKTIIAFLVSLLINLTLIAQYTAIPDTEFEWNLIASGIDSEGTLDGQVLTSDIVVVTELIITWRPFLTDLTGIEDFISLEELRLLEVGLTEIDLSQNLNLRLLDLTSVALNSLNIDNNVNLEDLYISVNCNTCFDSDLSSLNIANNVLLTTVVIGGTLIEYLDFSNNIALNLVDISANNYDLHNVNLKNGNNSNCNWVMITAPNLICVQVDDPESVLVGVDPPYDSWDIQSGIITDDCTGIGIDDLDLSTNISVYPNPVNNVLNVESKEDLKIKLIKIFNVVGKIVIEHRQVNRINFDKLSKGIYFINIETDIGIVTKKVIKI